MGERTFPLLEEESQPSHAKRRRNDRGIRITKPPKRSPRSYTEHLGISRYQPRVIHLASLGYPSPSSYKSRAHHLVISEPNRLRVPELIASGVSGYQFRGTRAPSPRVLEQDSSGYPSQSLLRTRADCASSPRGNLHHHPRQRLRKYSSSKYHFQAGHHFRKRRIISEILGSDKGESRRINSNQDKWKSSKRLWRIRKLS
ncbi:hypothetical protein ISN44_As09g022630 [Arabidopsis suecica]|uniref:Uncharacterized protein n=1 Tax=Arabidopsis suecica TaxID=45249 RepID=A0A8T2AJE2_ARASU|nr:hypothetical protein ISN44_As09g022630 [Arabidopsis suecica]